MFVSKEHSPQLLSADCYHSQERFDEEMARLILPGWHCLGMKSDFPQDGSYRTMDVYGNPIILWRKNDEYHAFLNVCSHRFTKLTGKPCGAMAQLRCQYHGWEYDETGNTRKIPEARNFKPLAPGVLGLKRYQVELFGELIFVSFADNPPPLSTQLGPVYDLCRDWFRPDMVAITSLDRDIAINWKGMIENSCESYHTAEVHPHTFGAAPPEQDITHEIGPHYTWMTVNYAHEKSMRKRMDDFAHRAAGMKSSHEYQHICVFPNVMFTRLSTFRWVECVVPVAPGIARSVVRSLAHAGPPGLRRRINHFFLKRWAHSFMAQVAEEDAALMPHIQDGLAARDQPHGGLISTREERVYHFQRFVVEAMERSRRERPTLEPAARDAEDDRCDRCHAAGEKRRAEAEC